MSGQWMPSPLPMSRKFALCFSVAVANAGQPEYGTVKISAILKMDLEPRKSSHNKISEHVRMT